MFSFVTSRFTKTTEDECKRYLTRIGEPWKCLYGSSNLISSSVPGGGLVFVIEMRINTQGEKRDMWLPDDNQISGIGMIVNQEVLPDFYCDVYENKLFNQFTYMGKERIDRTELLRMNPLLIELLDTILFKGKTHQKRNAYISVLHDDFLKDHRNIVKTQVKKAIEDKKIDPTHLNDLLTLDVKQTIVDLFKQKRQPFWNKKRKAAPTTEPIIIAPTNLTLGHTVSDVPCPDVAIINTIQPNKHARENDDDDDEQVFADFFDGYQAAATLSSETDDIIEYDFSDFVDLWNSEEANLEADAKEEALYKTIYHGANILAAVV